MAENKKKKLSDLKEGIRIGRYFVAFPPGNFIETDEDGGMHVIVEIYKIDRNDNVDKALPEEITPDLEQAINDEINNMLLQAMQQEQVEMQNKKINK